MSLRFQAPVRFMQTNVVVLPLDPHGPIRELHDRIKASGLLHERPRFTFTPHVTLSFFPEPTPENLPGRCSPCASTNPWCCGASSATRRWT